MMLTCNSCMKINVMFDCLSDNTRNLDTDEPEQNEKDNNMDGQKEKEKDTDKTIINHSTGDGGDMQICQESALSK